MAKNEAKIRFTAETGEFNESIKKSNDSMKELTAELKLNAEKMKTAGASVEGLEENHRILSAQLETAQSKTEALNQKLNKAAEIFGEGSAEVSKLRTQLLNAQTAEEKIRQAIDKCNSELEEQKSAANSAETETKQLDNALDDVEDSAKDAGEGFTVLKGTLADLASSGIQAAISGIGDLAGSIVSIGEETKEYRTIMASLDNSSQLAGYSAEETAATFEHLNGVLGDSQASATTTANLQAIGLEQSKLQTLTDGVIGAWAKYGDSIPIDGLGEAINHTAQLGEVQGTLADVLEWGGLSVEDFNEKLASCKDTTERANLISKMLADQGLTSAGQKWQETNKDIVDLNNAQADYEANTAALADTVAPVTTSIKDGFNGIFEKCLELTSGIDFTQFATTLSEAFGTFTEEILPKIVDGFGQVATGIKDATQWAQEHQGVLIAVGTAVGVVAGGIALYNAAMAIKEAMDVANVTTVGALVKAHIAQAAAAAAAMAPYILIVAAIAAVIAIIVLLIKNWDDVVAKVKEVWAKVKETLAQWGEWIDTNVIQPVVKFFTGLWNSIKETFANVGNWFKEKFTAAKEGAQNAWSKTKQFFSDRWSDIKGAFSNAGSWFKEKFQNAKENSVNAWSNAKTLFSGIKDKIVSAFSNIKEKITAPFEKARDVIKGIVDKIKGFFAKLDIKLPHIKLPHFSIEGEFSLSPPSIPHLSVEWYKEGGILTKPTIFGLNGGNFMAGGEAGAEAILPIEKLEGYIAGAIEKTMNIVNLAPLADAIEELANRPVVLNVNGRQFATATAGDGDSVNGLRSTFKSRGLVLD